MAADLYGLGLRFPPLPDGGLPTVSGADAVAQSLRSILLTEPGERIGRPSYGVGLRRFLFAPNTVGTRTAIRQAVAQAVTRDEPRAILQDVRVTEAPDEASRIDIELRWVLIQDPTPRNLVYPFYTDRA